MTRSPDHAQLHVYQAIRQIVRAFAKSGIPKRHTNAGDGYQYRSIEDVMRHLSPLLAKSGLCVLPRALEQTRLEVRPSVGPSLWSVSLKIAFDLVSAHDASIHTVEAYSEAFDEGDKATAKAMSSAYKIAMLQTFCIPVQGLEDTDTPQLKHVKSDREPAPVQGWDQWAADIKEMITNCASEDAVGRIQNTYRSLLKAISRERPDLYRSIGSAVTSSHTNLAKEAPLTVSSGQHEQQRIASTAITTVTDLVRNDG